MQNRCLRVRTFLYYRTLSKCRSLCLDEWRCWTILAEMMSMALVLVWLEGFPWQIQDLWRIPLLVMNWVVMFMFEVYCPLLAKSTLVFTHFPPVYKILLLKWCKIVTWSQGRFVFRHCTPRISSNMEYWKSFQHDFNSSNPSIRNMFIVLVMQIFFPFFHQAYPKHRLCVPPSNSCKSILVKILMFLHSAPSSSSNHGIWLKEVISSIDLSSGKICVMHHLISAPMN